VFDVGHRVRSFSFEEARQAPALGLAPATISSDLHRYNVHGPVFDLATTMSKFLLLGVALPEVPAKTTSVPSRLLGLDDRLGAIRQGFLADSTIFRLAEGNFEFDDGMKLKVAGR
jgi:dihydroorotase